jgi:hypothetical protein
MKCGQSVFCFEEVEYSHVERPCWCRWIRWLGLYVRTASVEASVA